MFGPYKSYLRTRVKSGSATAYVISNYAARQIVSKGVPVTRVADWPTCVEEMIKEDRCRVVYPVIVGHPPYIGRSTITDYEFVGSRIKNKRRILGIYVPPCERIVQSYTKGFVRLMLWFVTKGVSGQQTPGQPR